MTLPAISFGVADRKPALDELLSEADASRCLAAFVAGGVEGLAVFRDDGPAYAVASRPGGVLTRWDTLPPEALTALRRGGDRSFGLEGPRPPDASEPGAAARTSYRFEVRPLFAGAERVAVLVVARRTEGGGAIEPRLCDAVAGVLGQLLQSSFAAWITSQVHLAASEESHEELAHRNAELQRAVEHLRQLDKLKSNFLATVSHELRTPLTSVIGFSEMLLEGLAGPLNEEQREYVDTIHHRGEELLSLITDLLEMSQLEGGSVRLSLQAHSVPELLVRALDAVRLAAEQAGIELHLSHAQVPIPRVVVDGEKIQRVLVNLLGNAIKFTPAGGHVTVEACMAPIRRPFQEETLFGEEDPDAVRITVRDTGIGIAPEQLGRVFEAFYQVDQGSTRAYGGAGLGLSIVRNLVVAHGGEVWAESEPGRGTAISFTLPVASAVAESAEISE
ncbi:sensor histidine kinase [Paraliomyxa miuraensis]|uniref:sensor histidine kinase n=1 Tax=Paraliomyxa miuraensis TaxID=376150 RepID=UPI00225BD1CA|nr:HAMP domain-containing sensor histidine kinase [Paraliomyxa miuraensis]MCX4245859.1 HAMP domain-containing histidine kinase [Paraliomyxa miuraensis]